MDSNDIFSLRPRLSLSSTERESQDRFRAMANKTFDSSLKLKPLLPKNADAAGVIQDTNLPSIRSILDDSFGPRSYSLPVILAGKPLKIYEICGKKYMMQAPERSEPVQTYTRMTQEGRELTYRLEMCQQPRQARACGNGARSSADRRPVDPPPVISLTIQHGKTDITATYEASFMLWASLEHARPIARGTLQPTTACPVITGVCVAGAAYLTKPSMAAYFIFPDLSVRHEGLYRLRFHLFEQPKRLGDMDEGITILPSELSTFENPLPGKEHENMVNRGYVLSEPFQVFSAKRFPGLQPSTELSKVIADQGCRVRIRREVRQRRTLRKGKDDDASSQRSIYNYRDGSLDSQTHHDYIQPGPSRESRRMSIDSQASQSYAQARNLSYSVSTMPSPALPAPRYGNDRTAPTTPIIAEPEQVPSYNNSYALPPVPQVPIQRGFPSFSPSATSTSNLPSMTQILNSPVEPPRPAGGLYKLPPPTSHKRVARSPEYSPAVLKDGARPSIAAPTRPSNASIFNPPTPISNTHDSRMPACYGDTIIQADDDSDEDEDKSDDEILNYPYTYRRATGQKVTPNFHMTNAYNLWRRS